jgi:hypothetical protein
VYIFYDVPRTEGTGNTIQWWRALFLGFSTNSFWHVLHLQIVILLFILSLLLHRQTLTSQNCIIAVCPVPPDIVCELLASALPSKLTRKGVSLTFNDSVIVRMIFQRRGPTFTFPKYYKWNFYQKVEVSFRDQRNHRVATRFRNWNPLRKARVLAWNHQDLKLHGNWVSVY